MMKIEIAKLERMSQTGSSLMTLYQDKQTPVLDLLVRESVQNCLDAGKQINENAEQKKFVEVSFLTGDFCPANLNGILEGSTAVLNRRFPESNARYLAIRDKYAIGLTGPMRMNEVEDYQYGNLLKLVYDICKPQEGAGAGGSWGIGKTIYFRIGIGLVVYYSRIWDDSQNKFASRFAVSIVEDERSKDTIIPRVQGENNRGIAWWGAEVNDCETEPITDEEEIRQYLKIFNIEPYSGKETGTTIIIPYINEDWLLTNNRVDESESESDSTAFSPDHTVPTWRLNIDEYLAMSVQRWYFPRLNNSSYKYGKFLRLYVNGKKVGKSDMKPLFIHWQNLYNSAAQGKKYIDTEYCDPINIELEKITVSKYANDTCAGYVAFSTIGRNKLGMCPPDNLYSPYIYTDLEDSNGDSNKPLFAFCRMPGMIVNYQENETWLNLVPFSDKDSYVIAIFVLNSLNEFKSESGLSGTFEEYVRKSELADHHNWDDYNTGDGKKPDFIAKIKKNTAKKLAKAFETQKNDTETKVDSGWSKVMTDLILPKEGFGTKSTRRNSAPSGGLSYESNKGISIALYENKTRYSGDSIEFTYDIKTKAKTQCFNLNLYINSEAKAISLSEWENDGLELPFEIQSVKVCMDKLDGKKIDSTWEIKNDAPNVSDSLLKIESNKTPNGITYGIQFDFSESHSSNMTVTFTLKIASRKVKPILKPE